MLRCTRGGEERNTPCTGASADAELALRIADRPAWVGTPKFYVYFALFFPPAPPLSLSPPLLLHYNLTACALSP